MKAKDKPASGAPNSTAQFQQVVYALVGNGSIYPGRLTDESLMAMAWRISDLMDKAKSRPRAQNGE